MLTRSSQLNHGGRGKKTDVTGKKDGVKKAVFILVGFVPFDLVFNMPYLALLILLKRSKRPVCRETAWSTDGS